MIRQLAERESTPLNNPDGEEPLVRVQLSESLVPNDVLPNAGDRPNWLVSLANIEIWDFFSLLAQNLWISKKGVL
jgi:hypothetical protein